MIRIRAGTEPGARKTRRLPLQEQTLNSVSVQHLKDESSRSVPGDTEGDTSDTRH
jgi:hypothetical protein